MRKEFVMRGKTASGETEVLNFSGFKPGMAYRLTEFLLFPSTATGTTSYEMCGSITAGKTAMAPADQNFNDEGLIATSLVATSTSQPANEELVVINDTYMITQNLILMVQDVAGGSRPVNWQCRFESVKMNGSQEAATNYKQYLISDGS